MESKYKILVVDDDDKILDLMEDILLTSNFSFEIKKAKSEVEAYDAIKKSQFDIAIIDLKLGEKGDEGIEIAKKIKSVSPKTLTIIMTAYPSLETAIYALRLESHDYLIKPFTPEQLINSISQATRKIKMREKEEVRLINNLNSNDLGEIIFASERMKKIMETVQKIAPVDCEVLITGESGVGKELIARTIHKLSPRAGKEFVAVNSAAIPENLIEAELFGYEKGAFTGANQTKKGLIECADGGTLFLDEICDMPPQSQAKLLRFLQEKTIRRLGSTKEIKLDVRVIAATNKDIENEVKEGKFREDLFWRINQVHIHIPPLRERKEDIPALANYFLKKYSSELGKEIEGFDEEAMKIFEKYSWPGNVRELQNVIKKIVIFSQNRIITKKDIPENIIENSNYPYIVEDKREEILKIDEIKRKYLEEVIEKFDGDVKEAQKFLGISKSTFYRLLKKYNITPEKIKKSNQMK